jgi:uncharacterized protein (DUF1015 family)
MDQTVAERPSPYHDPFVPELRPFRALRYDASAVPDISAVLCPPYDVISADERRALAERDPRNAVHVELPESYTQAAATFQRWMADGALRLEDGPRIYLYVQSWRGADGADHAARGFFCRLKLEDYGPQSGVRPHEHTMSGPKEDRFQLMTAVRANLSPVLFVYDDQAGGRRAADLVDSIAAAAPDVEGTGPGGLVNRLWVVDPSQSDAGRDLLAVAAARPVTIADGHHRYETALRYRNEVGGGSSDYVLALMYEASSGGLELWPWHRVLRGIDPSALIEKAPHFYAVRYRDSAAALLAAVDALPYSMGLWTRDGGAVLTIERDRVGAVLPEDMPDAVRWLDVSVLSSTLSPMTGFTSAELSADGRLTYTADAAAALAAVDSGEADAAVIVRPTPIHDVLAVADAGDFMPAKSTYFFPKAATGLVFNPLAD